jgi:hypothetical protein
MKTFMLDTLTFIVLIFLIVIVFPATYVIIFKNLTHYGAAVSAYISNIIAPLYP